MTTSKRKDYGEIAQKVSKLLKEGVGIVQILNSASLEHRKLNSMKYKDK